MVIEGFIRIEQVAEDLAEHPLLRDIPIDRIINYAQEFIKIVGAPKLFYDKVARVKIEHFRGVLPCDFVREIQVRGADNHEEYVSTMNSFHMDHKSWEEPVKPRREEHRHMPPPPPHHSDEHEPKHNPYVMLSSKCCPEDRADLRFNLPTYKIQGNVIITSREHCDVEIAYLGIPVDENGWPMFPDNGTFVAALEAYIKKQRFQILFDTGQINANVYNATMQDYAWRVGQAQSDLVIPTLDEMETITNLWHNLIPNMTAHRNGFATLHNKELLRRH